MSFDSNPHPTPQEHVSWATFHGYHLIAINCNEKFGNYIVLLGKGGDTSVIRGKGGDTTTQSVKHARAYFQMRGL